ncbi:hypothetical protein LIER_07440 [Lithospermum erythrorhizon]|uniref:Uncharacterized protein n=1 Tax=Lithospermum erythrorhizon TaxID=34254 RepID=A0AAV3P888_LITER
METPPHENTKFAVESSCKFNEVADVFNEFKKVSVANSFGNCNSGDEIDCEVKDGQRELLLPLSQPLTHLSSLADQGTNSLNGSLNNFQTSDGSNDKDDAFVNRTSIKRHPENSHEGNGNYESASVSVEWGKRGRGRLKRK